MKRPSLDRLLKKWQPLLGLEDWTIAVSYRGDIRQDGDLCIGLCASIKRFQQSARIWILDPAFHPHDVENTLLHELHHLRLGDWGDEGRGHDFIDHNTDLLLKLDRRSA